MIYQTEVDGVPTLVAAASGPLHAGLTFRVGRADETLARAGITHLIEHLALHRHGLTDYHFNGTTGATVTHFHMRGAEDDVVAFLGGVCDALANLPYDRLETEKGILGTEEAGRGTSVGEQLAVWRYGACGYGLLGYPEWGTTQLTPEDLWHWVRTWFTRENACLWIAGAGVPAGLKLRLPGGTRRPLPVPTSTLPATPAFFQGSVKGVAFDAVVRRRTAATVYSAVLERVLFRALRQEGGYSYTAACKYDTYGGSTATVTAVADAHPEQQDAVLGGFVDSLMQLAVGRVDEGDLAAVRTKAEESLRHPEVYANRLPSYAVNVLTGFPSQSVEQIHAELRSVTAADVHQVAVEAMGSGLLMTPPGRDARWAGFTRAPIHSVTTAAGGRYVSRDSAEISLIVGPDEAGLIQPDGPVTVRYDQCAANLVWPDGGRRLIGHDGLMIPIEPTLFEIDATALAALDAAVPPELTVRMPARDPAAIPQPRPAATAAGAAGGRGAASTGGGSGGGPAAKRGWLELVTLVILGGFVTLAACAGLLGTLGVASDDTVGAGGWVVVGCVWTIAIVAALPMIVLLRRRRT